MKDTIKQRIEQVRRGEVPKGYQRNKSFIFPNDWELLPLNTVLFENKERNFNKKYSKGDVLSVSGESGVVNQIVFMGRSYAGASVDNYHVVETGDLVYTKSPLKENPYGIIKLNCGNPGIVSTLYAVYHCQKPYTAQYLNQYFCIDRYLNNYLKPLVKRGAKNDMKVNNDDVIRGHIAFPSDAEQQKIIKILAQCDKVIALKQELLDEKRKQKKWMMQKLLKRQATWVKATIGKLTTICAGATPSTKEQNYWNGDIRWMSSGELNLKQVYEVKGRISENGLKNSGTKMLPKNCVLVGLAGQGKTRGTVAINHVPLCTNQSIAAILPCNKFSTEYMFWNLESRYMELRKLSSGDEARGGLNLDLIGGLVVYLPPIEEQERIASILSTADKEINLLEQELAAWKEKKEGLTQLLLTGLVRV